MRYAALLSLLLCAACAGSTSPPTLYLLRADPQPHAAPVEVTARLALGRVTVAPYLDRTGIVVETQPGRVQAAREHQWAEPLDAGLRSLLRAELSSALGSEVGRGPDGAPELGVDVYVDRLHGDMQGEAEIDASYRIVPRSGHGEAVEYRFTRRASLPREGYPGLVDAETELVRQLARAIAASVQGLPGPTAP